MKFELPNQIQAQLAEVARIESCIARSINFRPKRGPVPKICINKPLPCLVSDMSGMDRLHRMYAAVVGTKYQGNKRIGSATLYADLLQYFIMLKRNGITLPRNKSLSVKACQLGLPDILRRHGRTDLTDRALLNSNNRKQIARKMDRIFSHIADVIENTPA